MTQIKFRYGYLDDAVPEGWRAVRMIGWHGLRKRVLLERVGDDKRKGEGS